MDATIADLTRFNEFLDSTMDPKTLDEEFITLRQVELEDIAKNADGKHIPFIALSYAKLMELTLLLAGTYSDNCRMADFGDLVANPRRIDVCILNTGLIKEEYGVTSSIPLWFKRQVRDRAGSQYSEDLGRMVIDPSLLLQFVERGLLLRTVTKERHRRLSDQFRDCILGDPQLAFPEYVEEVKPMAHSPGKVLGCGCGRVECLDVASWLSSSTVLNIVTGTLKTDLMDVLREVMSEDYLESINRRFEKAVNSLHYVSMGRQNFANYPYDDGVPIAEWDEINHTLCHFTMDDYSAIQSELDKSLSSPYYRSPFLSGLLYSVPETPGTSLTQMSRYIM
jgi:hypothetical protein